MGSFLPLIEAFIALGLTMIVLTTGVSSLSGSWQRAIRARARGLRALLKCVYVLAVKTQARASEVSVTIDGEAALCRFVGEMSLLPGKLAEIAALPADAQDEAFRRALPDLAPDAECDPAAVLPVWSSLADSLDTLSDDEFKARFDASTVGKALQQADGYAARFEAIHAQFVAHGHAATETYARDARWHSTAFAALLVLAANIDAFNLLETYLANPALTAAIIDKYERVARGEQAGPSSAQAGSDTARQATLQAFDDNTKAVLETAPVADRPRVEKNLQAARALVEASLDTREAARAVVADATANFPVGWDRYPGCARPDSDARCAALVARIAAKPGSTPTGSDVATETLADLQDTLGTVQQAYLLDRPRLLRWAAGLILTIVMLGLGTPFWIQTVNGLLRARDLARGGNKAGDGSRPGTPAAASGDTA